MNQKTIYIAWAQALFSVLVLWGLGNLAVGVSSKIMGNNGLVYTCTLFISSAWVLLLYAGHGPLSKETLRSIDTWAYGVVLIVGFLASFALFSKVTAAEGALLQRSSILASLVTSWFFLSRNPTRQQLLGAFLVLGGLVFICSELPHKDKAFIYILVAIFAFLQTARVLIAEYHRPHIQATKQENSTKARARVVGYVMFVVGMMFLVISFMLSLLQYYTGDVISTAIPTLSDYMHPSSIFWGILIGILVIGPIRLIEFSSSHVIKSENYLALASLAPVSTLFWEWATSPITGMSLKEFSNTDMIAGAVMTLGGLIMALGVLRKDESNKPWKEYLEASPQNVEQVEDSRDLVASTLEHFNGNIAESAQALDISAAAIEALLNDRDKILAFKAEVLNTAARNYRKNVALSDALTSLVGRTGFKLSLKEAVKQDKPFSLLYIDLDKFKPINDTYGHEAGDQVLRAISERLMEACQGSTVARLGGDEFCIILTGHNKKQAEKQIESLIKTIEEPIAYEKEAFKVSASIGLASYPEDSTDMDELLELSDKNMYKVKQS